MPWPERLLSVDIETPCGPLEMHTTLIPPGVTDGWIKIEMREGLYAGLARPSTAPRILGGDFNRPQLELPTDEVMTWGAAHQQQRDRCDTKAHLWRRRHALGSWRAARAAGACSL